MAFLHLFHLSSSLFLLLFCWLFSAADLCFGALDRTSSHPHLLHFLSTSTTLLVCFLSHSTKCTCCHSFIDWTGPLSRSEDAHTGVNQTIYLRVHLFPPLLPMIHYPCLCPLPPSLPLYLLAAAIFPFVTSKDLLLSPLKNSATSSSVAATDSTSPPTARLNAFSASSHAPA